MKILFRRAIALLRGTKTPDPKVESAAPLVCLLGEAEPAPDMFAHIEAQIDAERTPRKPAGRKLVLMSFVVGVCAGALAVWQGQERQRIVAKPTADAAWAPLGTVTLHGSELRAFVRDRCHGHTHFLITMHGQSPDTTPDEIPLMDHEEKILMECIF